jgi:pimeloyl-ACP methyl ester carboxylesterase
MTHRVRPTLVRVVGACVILASAAFVIPANATEVTAETDEARATKTRPSVIWDKCRASVPDDARCGHIRTAVDPLRPRLGKQRVGFEWYPRSNKKRPSQGTLVGHEGGPGYPSTGSRGYFLGLFEPMSDRHDVLLVDQRGTGTSDPIRCTPLQRGARPYVQAVADCGEFLGARADTYSTAYAADDTAAVMDALRIKRINLYGDSYGTFFAQTFALRHPDRVRTLILDAAYPVSDQDPWWRDTNRAIQDALTRVCVRDPQCAAQGGSPVDRMRTIANDVHHDPVVTETFGAEGNRKTVRLDGVNLALVTAYATYGTNIYRELDSAVRAYQDGYAKPLLRLVAENIYKSYAGGNPEYYSSGQYVAVICSDYPQLWDVSLPIGEKRQKQYQAEVDALQGYNSDDFDPFRVDDWIDSGWTEPRTCIGWPSPTNPIPPELPGTVYPDVPTLVLSGDLDTVTSPEGGMDSASRFPNSTFVSVPNVGHVTALGDRQGCAAGIVRRFIRTAGDTGDTSCVSDYAPVRTVPEFVRTAEELNPARQGDTVESSRADRQVVEGSLLAAGDVLTRWWVNYSGKGVGLGGGTFKYSGRPVTFELKDLGFVRDVRVTGRVVWDRDTGNVRAVLDVDGPGTQDGKLTARWNDWERAAKATVTGKIDGRPIDLSTPAP